MQNSLSYQSFKKSPHHCTKHSTYFETYDHLFGSYRDREIIFVEIGVLGGGSLFMWRDFFGPKARIIGIELDPRAKKWEEHGFEIFIGSQSDENFWHNFIAEVGPVDIILDDGGHTYEQQIITTECLIDNINDGGILVVEDTHTSYMRDFGPRKYSFIEYTKQLFDKINYRFSRFEKKNQPERRIWSIEVFESIVAFRVNRSASSLQSELHDNGTELKDAVDQRYSDNASMQKLQATEQKSKFLRRFPPTRYLFRGLRMISMNSQFTAKRFFK